MRRFIIAHNFMTIHFHLLFLLLLLFGLFTKNVANAKQWTEDDEKRRIAKIKEDELREFKEQMGSSARSGGGVYGGTEAMYGDSAMPPMSGGGFDYSGEGYPRYRGGANQKYPPRSSPTLPSAAQIFTPQPAFISSSVTNGSELINWCFYCSSPLRILDSPMQLAIQNLLDIRRAKFPKDAVTSDCHKPANIRALPKQQCKHSYCQTLVLTEHERGVSFTMRGCAENFAAINEDLLNERGDNHCVKIHPTLELQECVCKNRKYCYRGSTDDRIEEASKQIFKFNAEAQNGAAHRNKFYMYDFKIFLLSLILTYFVFVVVI